MRKMMTTAALTLAIAGTAACQSPDPAPPPPADMGTMEAPGGAPMAGGMETPGQLPPPATY